MILVASGYFPGSVRNYARCHNLNDLHFCNEALMLSSISLISNATAMMNTVIDVGVVSQVDHLSY